LFPDITSDELYFQQSVPFGQHNNVAFAARGMHACLGGQQKLLGSPAWLHWPKEESAHIESR
jgi:hypothetical protein